MSEDIKDTVEQVEKSAQLEPLLEGVSKIADSVVKSEKRNKEAIEQIQKDTERQVDDLSAKMERGFEDVGERLNRLRAGKVGLNIEETRPWLDLVPKSVKQYAAAFEKQSATLKSDSTLRDTGKYMAAHAWMLASTKAQVPRLGGGRNYAEAADKLCEAMGGPAVTKADLQENVDSEGGYLVPEIVEMEVARQIMDAGQIFPRARQIAMTTRKHQVPNEATAVTVSWVDEEGTISETGPAFGQTTLEADKLAGRATMSIELVQDSNVGLLAYLLEVFSEKMAGELDFQCILGDGTAPDLLGVTNAANLVRLTSATVAGRNLSWSYVVQTFTGASEQSSRRDAAWIVSPRGYTELLSLRADAVSAGDGAGMPIVHAPGQDIRGNAAGFLLGKPIIESARLGGGGSTPVSLDDATNDNTKIVFGPPRGIYFGTRAGMSWDVTDQVNWAKYQIDARLIGRFAAHVPVGANFVTLEQINTPAF